MLRLPVLCSLLLVVACASSEEAPVVAEPTEEVTEEPEVVSFEDWTPETIELPPGFAPELPTGVEVLRFAPGWRDASAEDFWSYAFVLWIDEPLPDAARIDALLEAYYDGLMAGPQAGDDPAQVAVVATSPGHFEVQIRMFDAFTTQAPMDLRMLVEAVAEDDERSILRIQASPQPPEHAIWRSLEAVVANIER